MYFAGNFVFTLDQHEPDPRRKVKPFPVDRLYLLKLVRLWEQDRLIVVCKPRQMIITWLCCVLAVWDVIFHSGRLVILQSKKLEDAVGNRFTATGLLGRCQFILDHIPYRELLLPKMEDKTESLTFSHNSGLLPIPMGGEMIRQHTASGWVCDEAAFQAEFEAAFTAAQSCLRGGGWALVVSTADLSDGGFFKRLYKDMPDA
jgi:hypothetical protein